MRTRRFLPLLTFAALLLGGLTAFAGGMDVELRMLTKRAIASPQDAPPRLRVKERNGRLFVSVLVEGTPSSVIPAIQAAGGQVHTTIDNRFMTATVPLKKAKALADRADVVRMEAGSAVRTYNDLGNLAAGNASRASAAEAAPPYASANGNGENVVVAAVDTGIDVHHPDFINPDGTTRILAYWDQTDYTDTNAPGEFGYGREYTQAEIQAAIDSGASLAPDSDGHGTHVMGTIAGNGRGADELAASNADYAEHYSAYQFTGVAPKAKIVFVKFDFGGERNTTASIVDGVDFCFRRSGPAPCSVNLSLGSDFGPHDGTTLEERMLDSLTGPGKVVFAAAGNAGEVASTASSPQAHLPPAAPIHGSGTLTTGGSSALSFDLQFNALGRNKGKNNDYIFFTIWYEGDTTCDLEVTTPTGAVYTHSRFVTGQDGIGLSTDSGAVFVYNAPDSTNGQAIDWGTDNGDHELYIEVSDATGASDVRTGTWTFTLKGTSGTSAYHGWHGLSDNFRGVSPLYEGQNTNNTMTVGSPATATTIISVGAYALRGDGNGTATENGWWTASAFESYDQASFPVTLGDLAFFSSRGPDRNGIIHPDITASGVGVISSLSADAAPSGGGGGNPNKGGKKDAHVAAWAAERVVVGNRYAVSQGTSMSTPNAAGAGALALAKDPLLGPTGLRAAIRAGARTDAFVNGGSNFASDPVSAPNNDWGYGKLDVPGMLANVTATPQPPVAVISGDTEPVDSDADGTETVTLDGSGSYDPDGGSLTYSWTDGSGTVVGTSATLQVSLAVGGPYAYTLTVTDDESDTDAASVSVTVHPAPPPATTCHVADLDGTTASAKGAWTATVTVTVRDANGVVVPNAEVVGTWSSSGSDVGITDANGQVSFTSSSMKNKTSSVTFTVNGVNHGSLTYDSSGNADPDGDSDGTTITVSR